MVLNNSFFISTNGLFDFDFTFLSQAFLFLLLSISVTNFFLLPISKQIDERNAYISYNIRKLDILINLAYEKIQQSSQIIFDETKELARQSNLVKIYVKSRFEKELDDIQKENTELISKVKTSLVINSMKKFASLNIEIKNITEFFFTKKFSFE
jgi:F0F1-type ATP synthase membrane subunit b/b'